MNIASLIDHTLLRADASSFEIEKLCEEARQYSFAAVCVNPVWVPQAVSLLKNDPISVATVSGFPLGANLTRVKILEAELALGQGAEEIDMVLNIGALKSGNLRAVEEEIAEIATLVHSYNGKLKCIIESVLLTDEEKICASLISKNGGADFVKTSTGFASGGATLHDVKLIRKTIGEQMGLKASGGISSYSDAVQMVKAGATRIGASAGVKIVRQSEKSPTG
jgi:deoxyribose-phosphate aldolase